jgi:hypothetical protein
MKLDVNGILAVLRQIAGIASILLATAVLLKLFGMAPRFVPGSMTDLAAATIATALASK